MYQDSKCICTAIVLLIKPFVWWLSRCLRRRGLLKLLFFTRRLCHKSRPLIFYIPCFTEKLTLLYILNWKEYSFRITSYYRMYWINRTAVWFWAYAMSWLTFIEGCAFFLYLKSVGNHWDEKSAKLLRLCSFQSNQLNFQNVLRRSVCVFGGGGWPSFLLLLMFALYFCCLVFSSERNVGQLLH